MSQLLQITVYTLIAILNDFIINMKLTVTFKLPVKYYVPVCLEVKLGQGRNNVSKILFPNLQQ